jgi:hypothetical protein
MFEDFRKQAEEAAFPDEDQDEELRIELTTNDEGRFLGMTPVQRFIVAVMLLFMTIILGVLFLIVTSKVTFPFLG